MHRMISEKTMLQKKKKKKTKTKEKIKKKLKERTKRSLQRAVEQIEWKILKLFTRKVIH